MNGERAHGVRRSLRAGGEEAATGVAAFSYALFAVATSVVFLVDALVADLDWIA